MNNPVAYNNRCTKTKVKLQNKNGIATVLGIRT